MTATIQIVIGSKNSAKIESVKLAAQKVFPNLNINIVSIDVPSGVASQPLNDEETMNGAINRAKAAMNESQSEYAIGIEGGVQKVGNIWLECGWVCVIDSTGKMGLGTSPRYQLSDKIMKRILAGVELADVIDEFSGMQDVRSSAGAMGILSNGVLNRAEAYVSGIVFAFAPFVSDERYWV